jgi:hypothetical protein
MGKTMTAQERSEAKTAFLASLQSDPNVSLACDVAKISREIAYRWREADKEFRVAWDNALERCRDVARSSIYKRGILGWDEPIVSMGQVVYELFPWLDNEGNPKLDSKGKPIVLQGKPLTIHKWSDSLATAYAKANLPEYKEKAQVNVQAQLSDLAEQAKQALLADLEASLTDDDKAP